MGYQRTKADEIRCRRAEVSRLLLRGWTQLEIAERLGVSQKTISGDAKAARAEWAEATVTSIGPVVEAELALLLEVEREAWAGWERSKEDIREHVERVTDSGPEHTDKRIGRLPDPRYLQRIMEARERISVLQGVEPTQLVEIRGRLETGSPLKGVPSEDLHELASALREAAGARAEDGGTEPE
jgi:transcriptional regulator with XRE-family HTH domain